MEPICRKAVKTPFGEKYISVYNEDIGKFKEPLDVLAVSAFYNSYAPVPNSAIAAIYQKGIKLGALAEEPEIDLRRTCRIWLSHEIKYAFLPVKRVGCIEMSPYSKDRSLWKDRKENIVSGIRAFFRMLDLASLAGIPVGTVGLPVLGSNYQRIDTELTMIPMLRECFGFLKTNAYSKEIKLIEIDSAKAEKFAATIRNSYSLLSDEGGAHAIPGRLAFISYSSDDKNIADNLCGKLEAAGVKVWYAPRDMVCGAYAGAIVDAISRCTDFVIILSKNSFKSEHVLNEIDLAFQEKIRRGIRFCPLKLDEEEMGPDFKYYLTRQHWHEAYLPPLEKRLDEYVNRFCRFELTF